MATLFDVDLVRTQLSAVEEAALVEKGWIPARSVVEADLWKKEVDGETFIVCRSTALAVEKFQDQFRDEIKEKLL